jgi:hypothetical protein
MNSEPISNTQPKPTSGVRLPHGPHHRTFPRCLRAGPINGPTVGLAGQHFRILTKQQQSRLRRASPTNPAALDAEQPSRAFAERGPRDRSRTIWAAPHVRAGRPLWSESDGRGAVSDLGGGEQPTGERAPRRRRGRPGPGVVVAWARRPRDATVEQERLRDTLGLTPERVYRGPSVRPGDVPRSG